MDSRLQFKWLTKCQEKIPELATLWYEEISKHWVPNASVERAKENLVKHLNTNKMPMMLVGFIDNKPVGMVALRETDGIQPELTPWLGSLVVHPEYRKCKIGEALIEAIKDQARAFGYEIMYLLAFDKTIPAWYTRLGWKTIGKDILFDHPVTVMHCSLM